MEGLLSSLGYEKATAFEKKRQVWRLGGCESGTRTNCPLLEEFVESKGLTRRR